MSCHSVRCRARGVWHRARCWCNGRRMESEYNPPQDPLEVLHEDHEILVLNKPAGLLSVPGKGAHLADCLLARAQEAFPTALLVHRLDRDTSGMKKDLYRKGLGEALAQVRHCGPAAHSRLAEPPAPEGLPRDRPRSGDRLAGPAPERGRKSRSPDAAHRAQPSVAGAYAGDGASHPGRSALRHGLGGSTSAFDAAFRGVTPAPSGWGCGDAVSGQTAVLSGSSA